MLRSKSEVVYLWQPISGRTHTDRSGPGTNLKVASARNMRNSKLLVPCFAAMNQEYPHPQQRLLPNQGNLSPVTPITSQAALLKLHIVRLLTEAPRLMDSRQLSTLS